MNILQQTGSTLLDLIFPKFCLGCRRLGTYFCKDCRINAPYQLTQRCIVCQKPALAGFTHPKCISKNKPDRLVTLYDYKTRPIAELIVAGKYQFVKEIFILLGTSFAEFLQSSVLPINNFEVTSIPLSKRRQRWRGFNQAEIIANTISQTYGLPQAQLLTRVKHTKIQKDLNKSQRLRNLKNAFEFNHTSVPERVILIDDVVTTGTTFLEATVVLKRAGVKQVWCLAIAQD